MNTTTAPSWTEASFILPRSSHLPVEAQLASGALEIRVTVSGDWRQVVRWRSVELTPGELRRLRKEQKVETEAEETEAAG